MVVETWRLDAEYGHALWAKLHHVPLTTQTVDSTVWVCSCLQNRLGPEDSHTAPSGVGSFGVIKPVHISVFHLVL